MGDIADMMLDGTLCSGCGVYLEGAGDGYATLCGGCQSEQEKPRKAKPTPRKRNCPKCGKQKRNLDAHMRAVHGKGMGPH